jgi:hypothetical protein
MKPAIKIIGQEQNKFSEGFRPDFSVLNAASELGGLLRVARP